MAKVYDNQGNPWADINNDGFGDFQCTDESCAELDYQGPDQDTSGTGDPEKELKYASLALSVLEKLLSFAKLVGDKIAESELRNAISKAKEKINSGQNQMSGASDKMYDYGLGIGEANSQLNQLSPELSQIKLDIGNTLSTMADLTTAISGVNGQISNLNTELAQANAIMDKAMNRANYPMTVDGLKQWRSDRMTSAKNVFDISNNIAGLENTREGYVDSLNVAGSKYNSLIPIAEAKTEGVKNAYDVLHSYEAKVAEASQQWRNGAGEVQGGQKTLENGLQKYNSYQENVAVPLLEASSGSRNLSSALNSFSEYNYVTGSEQIIKGGLESLVRNGGDAFAKQAFGSFGQLSDSLATSLDRTIKNGGNVSDFMKDALIESGNSFVGLNHFMASQQSFELANAISENKSNPIAERQAWLELSRNAVPEAIQGGAKIAETTLQLSPYPGATTLVRALTPAFSVGSTGFFTTGIEAVNTPTSQEIYRGEKNPLSIGGSGGIRNLTQPYPAGLPGKATVVMAGIGITLSELGKSTISQQIASGSVNTGNVQDKILNMSKSGYWTPPLRASGPDSISIRPGVPGTPTGITVDGRAVAW